MEALTFRNNSVQNKPEEVQKRLESQENFTALDTEKLKQDTVEIASKAKENVEDRWIIKQLKNLGVEDPKKLIKSIVFTVITTVGLMALGNKLSNKTADLGQIIGDDIIAKSKPYQWLQNGAKFVKNGLSNLINSNKYTRELHTTFTQKMEHAKLDVARGYGQGFLGIFSLTPVEILQKSLQKMGIDADKIDDAVAILNSKLRIDEATAREIAEQILKDPKNLANKLTRKEICTKLTDGIAQGFNCKSKKELLALFKDMQTNPEFEDFFNIKMSDKGLGAIASSWWPANIVNKLTGGRFQRYLTGNLGDSLVKFNVVNGTMAESKAGTFIQRLITIPTESISNFVNDKSGVGLVICGTCMIPLYNNVQDAPKKQKLPTILNDYVSSMGSFAFSMPAANAITYGLASLANLDTEGKVLLKPLKLIGSFFKTGLGETAITKSGFLGFLQKACGKAKGAFGGVMRLVLIMFVFSPMVSKLINKVVSKIFGKPYDPSEEKKAKELEEQKNTIIPELGITQGELAEKIEKNPKAIQKLQQDPKLAEAVGKNPKLMLDLLDGKDINIEEVPEKQKSSSQSPMLQDMINNRQNKVSNDMDLFGKKTSQKSKEEKDTVIKDMATYIPSSNYIAKEQSLSPETQQQYDRLLAQADKALLNAEKYI